MFSRSVGLIASCALAASAFLLPPSIAVEDKEARPFFENDGKALRFTFPCPSCDWEYDPLYNVTKNPSNKLLLNLHISKDNQDLIANDIIIFPQEKLDDSFNSLNSIYFDQIPYHTTEEEIEKDEYARVPLRVGMAGISMAEVQSMSVYDVYPIYFKVNGLGRKYMEDLPMLFIQLIRNKETQELEILSVNIDPSMDVTMPLVPLPDLDDIIEIKHSVIRPSRPHKQPCRLPGPLCSFSKLIGSAFGSGRRPCSGRKPIFDGEHLPTHIREHLIPYRPEGEEQDFSILPVPSHHEDHFRPLHGHRHGHHRHGFFHVVSRGILAVLIPIMAGITVGIIVSVLGLLFGRLLGFLWFTAFRGGRRGEYAAVATEEGHAVDVKEFLATEPEQPLPPYEDAPAYEEPEPKQ